MKFIYLKSEDDIPSAIKAHGLDKRFNYSLFGDTLCNAVKITEPCTGCNEHDEMTSGPDKGSGCHECGYTGKRVNYYPCAVSAKDGVTEFTQKLN